jgi:hypothetical protein
MRGDEEMTAVKLDTFTRAYIEAMLWSSHDESDERGGNPMDSNYSEDDIAPEALETIVADCRRFQEENAADIATWDQGNIILAIILFYLAGLLADLAGGSKKIIL